MNINSNESSGNLSKISEPNLNELEEIVDTFGEYDEIDGFVVTGVEHYSKHDVDSNQTFYFVFVLVSLLYDDGSPGKVCV